MNFLSYKYNLKFDNMVSDMDEYVKAEKEKLQQTSINDDYKTFLDNNEERLTEQFKKENTFRTVCKRFKNQEVAIQH